MSWSARDLCWMIPGHARHKISCTRGWGQPPVLEVAFAMDAAIILSPDRLTTLMGFGQQASIMAAWLATLCGAWLACTGLKKRKLPQALVGIFIATGIPVLGLVGWVLESGALGCAYF